MYQFTTRAVVLLAFVVLLAMRVCITSAQDAVHEIGREVAIPVHLQDGEEFATPIQRLIRSSGNRPSQLWERIFASGRLRKR